MKSSKGSQFQTAEFNKRVHTDVPTYPLIFADFPSERTFMNQSLGGKIQTLRKKKNRVKKTPLYSLLQYVNVERAG